MVDALAGGDLGVAPPSRIGLVGHSRGGGIAVLQTARDSRVRALVTWAAISSVERWSPAEQAEWRERGVEGDRQRPHRRAAAALPRRARRHRPERRRNPGHPRRRQTASPSPGSSCTAPRTRRSRIWKAEALRAAMPAVDHAASRGRRRRAHLRGGASLEPRARTPEFERVRRLPRSPISPAPWSSHPGRVADRPRDANLIPMPIFNYRCSSCRHGVRAARAFRDPGRLSRLPGTQARAPHVAHRPSGFLRQARRLQPAGSTARWRLLRRRMSHPQPLTPRLDAPSPSGSPSHPPRRYDEGGELIWAAVAVVLAPEPESVLLIRRAERAGDPWSGHMALPGGRRRSRPDHDLVATAIRETAEEVGLALGPEQLIGALDDVVPRTPVLPPIAVRPFVFRPLRTPPR